MDLFSFGTNKVYYHSKKKGIKTIPEKDSFNFKKPELNKSPLQPVLYGDLTKKEKSTHGLSKKTSTNTIKSKKPMSILNPD